ncbi:unnamed protein product [Amoebophrya sp. A25]|nr:unnamed protein product [Amoebophrya sp. A25]|eukprot:GSA25T00006765001.1
MEKSSNGVEPTSTLSTSTASTAHTMAEPSSSSSNALTHRVVNGTRFAQDDAHVSVDRRYTVPFASDEEKYRFYVVFALKLIFIAPWRFALWAIAHVMLGLFYILAQVEKNIMQSVYEIDRPIRETLTGGIAFKIYLAFCGIFVRIRFVEKKEDHVAKVETYWNLRDTPIIVSNHTGYVDGPLYTCFLYRCKPVMTSWVLDLPLIGRCARDLGSIPVDLRNEQSRLASMNRIKTHCEAWRPPPSSDPERPKLYDPIKEGCVSASGEGGASSSEQGAAVAVVVEGSDEGRLRAPLLQQGSAASKGSLPTAQALLGEPCDRADPLLHRAQACLIFPEGSCCNGERVGMFKKGAFTAAAPIRPVVAQWYNWGGWNSALAESQRDNDWINGENAFDADSLLAEYCYSSTDGSVGRAECRTAEEKSALKDLNTPRVYNAEHYPGELRTYSAYWWFLLFLMEPFHLCTLYCLPPYTPSQPEREDAELYAANVHRLIQISYQLLRKGVVPKVEY